MSDQKTPLDQALDLFVYAPLGLALSLRELLPQMAEKGRQQVTGQVTMARMVGEFAVNAGQQEAGKLVNRARGQAESVLGGGRPAAPARPSAPPRPDPVQTSAPAAPETPVTAPADPSIQTNGGRPAAAPPSGPRPDASSLGIPGYDTLSASQVVQRLAGLSREELDAVGAYESAGRGRKTILTKIAQLQGTNGAG